MAFNLDSITCGTRLRPPRCILLGTEKIGKSEFAARWPKPIFVPIFGEEGIDSIDVPQFPPSRTLSDVFSALETIRSVGNDFETIVIDSASALEPLIFNQLCHSPGGKNGQAVESIDGVLGGFHKGYTLAANLWRNITEWLDVLRSEKNMASVIIGHVKVKRFDDPTGESYDQYQFDIDGKAANALYRWSDLILFANTKSIVNKEDIGFGKEHKTGIDLTGGARFLYTQKRPAHPGGGRGVYGRLPYELPLDYTAFEAAIAAAATYYNPMPDSFQKEENSRCNK